MATSKVPATQSPEQVERTITDEQLQAALAGSRWQYAFCVECDERFSTHGAAEMHRGLHEAVLDYYDRALVN